MEIDFPTMEKTGRNDPCPCGSGKKYKKCHLAEDASTAAATPNAIGMALGEMPEELDTELDDGPFGLDREQEEIDAELDGLLHEFDFPDMLRLLTAFLPKAEFENPNLVRGFFERVWDAAESLKDRDAYRELLHRLEREHMELFAEIGGLLFWDILEQTVADGRQDSLDPLFVGYAAVASRDLILFMSLADGMAYFGFLEILVKGMRKGWPFVRDSKLLSPGAIERFARRAINYEVFSAFEESIRIDAGELGARIRYFEAWEDWEIGKCFELISGNRFEVLQREDFSTSTGKRRLNPELQAAFQDKLNTLVHVFRGFLRREKAVPWTQSDLAAAEILELLSEEWEDPFAGQPNQEEAPTGGNDVLIRNLCPDSDTLNAYFNEKLYEMDMQEFRACALWTNLFHWLELLVRLGLVDQSESRYIWSSWEPALEAVDGEFDSLPTPSSAGRSPPPGLTA